MFPPAAALSQWDRIAHASASIVAADRSDAREAAAATAVAAVSVAAAFAQAAAAADTGEDTRIAAAYVRPTHHRNLLSRTANAFEDDGSDAIAGFVGAAATVQSNVEPTTTTATATATELRTDASASVSPAAASAAAVTAYSQAAFSIGLEIRDPSDWLADLDPRSQTDLTGSRLADRDPRSQTNLNIRLAEDLDPRSSAGLASRLADLDASPETGPRVGLAAEGSSAVATGDEAHSTLAGLVDMQLPLGPLFQSLPAARRSEMMMTSRGLASDAVAGAAAVAEIVARADARADEVSRMARWVRLQVGDYRWERLYRNGHPCIAGVRATRLANDVMTRIVWCASSRTAALHPTGCILLYTGRWLM